MKVFEIIYLDVVTTLTPATNPPGGNVGNPQLGPDLQVQLELFSAKYALQLNCDFSAL